MAETLEIKKAHDQSSSVKLHEARERQRELFEDNLRIEKLERASAAIDAVNKQFNKHKVSLSTGLFLD